MKSTSTLLALALLAAAALLPGCGNQSAEPAPTPEAAPAVEATPAPEAAPAAEAAPVAEAAAAPAGPATYVIAPNDTDTLSFTGYKVVGKVHGSWSDYSGTVELADGTIESAKISMTFKMESLVTSAKMLTETLHNEVWFNIPAFPEATFTSTGIVKNGDKYDVSGDLTIRGITKPVKFPAAITIEGDTLKTQAKFELPRADWGMIDTGIGDGLIKENAEINFDITAKKS